MDIYIKSRGVSQDYRWFKVTQEKQKPEEPPIPQKINDLIDTNYPSLVLARFQQDKDSSNKLMLLITGLETSKRRDNNNREIRNSVAWIGRGDDESDEKILRSLAVQWLRNELTSKIDSAVESDKSNGFKVIFNNLPALKPTVKNNPDPKQDNKVGNLEKLRGELAKELEEYCLPRISNYLLIVASEVNTEKDFEKNPVWRGLSSLIASEDWKILSQEQMQSQANKPISGRLFSKKLTSIILATLLVISLGINFNQWQRITEQRDKITYQEKKLKEPIYLQENIDKLTNEQAFLNKNIEQLRVENAQLEKQNQNADNTLKSKSDGIQELNKLLEKILKQGSNNSQNKAAN